MGTTPLAYADTITRNEVLLPQPSNSMRRTSIRIATPIKGTQSLASATNSLDLVTVLRDYHYAVSNHRVVPIWQDPAGRKSALYKQVRAAKAKAARAQQARVTSHLQAARQSAHRTTVRTKATDDLEKEAASALTSRQSGPAQVSDLSGMGRTIARIALHLVGTAYRYGGDSTRGFDCSGLVQYVYKKVGMVLPRTSYEQFQVGQAISLKDLRPGDLLFFSTYGAGASHVAIYVGNGLIVQALNSRTGVIVSSLSDAYYRIHYIGARRP